jgi:hypothetical protein
MDVIARTNTTYRREWFQNPKYGRKVAALLNYTRVGIMASPTIILLSQSKSGGVEASASSRSSTSRGKARQMQAQDSFSVMFKPDPVPFATMPRDISGCRSCPC